MLNALPAGVSSVGYLADTTACACPANGRSTEYALTAMAPTMARAVSQRQARPAAEWRGGA